MTHVSGQDFFEEVLNTQNTEIREFLLQTSVVDRLCSELADALTGRVDGDTVPAALQTGNVLIDEMPDAPSWYRYHPLFASVLRAELRHEHPERLVDLHRRASTWFGATGVLIEAVRHAVAADDWQLAAAAVVRPLAIGRLLAGREASRLDRMFAALPPDEPGAMPAVLHAARAMVRFDLAECRAALETAEKRADDETGGDRAAVLASVAVIRALVARTMGAVDAAEAARDTAEAHLSYQPDWARTNPEMRCLLLSSVGSAQLWSGRFTEAEKTLREGLDISGAPHCEYPRLNIIGRLAFVEYRKGRLRRTAELSRQTIEEAESHGLPVRYQTGVGHLTLAMVAFERDDRAAYRHHLSVAERTLGARHDPFVMVIVKMLRAWQHALGRDFRRAFATLDKAASAAHDAPLPEWLAARIELVRAAVHLEKRDVRGATAVLEAVSLRDATWSVAMAGAATAAGDRARAWDLLQPVLSGELPEVAVSTIEGLLLAAHLHLTARQQVAAHDALRRALELAEPEHRRRPFTQTGPWLAAALRSEPDLAAAAQWLGPSLVGGATAASRSERHPSPSPGTPVEELTERERAVLTCLAQGLSIQDIAAELSLSVNTIKTHQKALYRKLSVARRNDAVRRARQLELI